jgi:membrane-associated phospholipid phosphatase
MNQPGRTDRSRAPGGRLAVRTLALAATLFCIVPIWVTPAPADEPNPPRVDPVSTDPVLTWNSQTNQAIQATSTDAFMASRALALESIAVLDTAKAIAAAPAFLVSLPAPKDTSPNVAIAAAAHEVLSHLFPARRATLDTAFAASLANAPAGIGRDAAAAFGKAVADAVIAVRDRDGWDADGIDHSGDVPGRWRPTPSGYLAALHPQWATLLPFTMTAPDQFRPTGPPARPGAAFRQAAAEVASLGDARSTVRTAEQTESARYWNDAIGSYAPAGHWNAIAAGLVARARKSLTEEAELFAQLNVGMADAGIAVADAKYTFWLWRPVTVIRAGGGGMAPGPNWLPLLDTPNHPSYISGHSAFSGAAATILTAWFGGGPFSFTSASVPGVSRSFANFQQAAEEAALSRLYGGIHFRFDNVDGLATGRAVGAWTLKAFQRLTEDRGPVLVMDHPAGTKDKTASAQRGFALDNAAPVKTVTVVPDGGKRLEVPVDSAGRFVLPPLGFAGPERMTLTATSISGHVRSMRVEIEGQGDAVTVPAVVK